MFSVLAHPVYRRLFGAQVVALVGTGVLTVALGLLAYDIAGGEAGAVLGTALAIKMVAYVAVAPVVTALTERWSRRWVMVSADAVRALIAVLLPFVDATWQIYALIFVLQAASATFTPSFQSVIPAVLTDERDYTKGLSLSRLAYDLESLFSPVLAAALLLVVPYGQMFAATALGFIVSAVLVATSSLPRPGGTGPPSSLPARLGKGVRVMLSTPALRGLLALNAVVAAGTGLVLVNTVVYVRSLLGGSDAGVAVALAAYGTGSMVVALVLPTILARAGDRVVMLGGAGLVPVGLAAAAVLLAVDPPPAVSWVALLLTWTLMGGATAAITTPSARLLRSFSDECNRAAVFTAQFSLSHCWFLLTYPLAGWGGIHFGHVSTVVILAVVATLAATAAGRFWPSTRVPVATGPIAAERDHHGQRFR